MPGRSRGRRLEAPAASEASAASERYGAGRRLADWAWPGHPATLREVPARLWPTLVQILRLTIAAVLSFLISAAITTGAVDLTGALTALLVMQASAYSTLKMGAVRVGAVLCGVLVATLLSTWIGLTWWSLGAAIAASLFLGKVFRLGEQALETPISAMLILAVTNPDIAAETRVLNTLIGAGVGVGFNLLYPPAMPTGRALRAVAAVAEAAARPLDDAASGLEAGPLSRDQVTAWVDDVRASATTRVATATKVLAALRDSRRLNPRALGVTDVEPVLSTGLQTLENCQLAVRSLLVVIQAELPKGPESDDPYGEELRSAFAVVLHDVADSLRGFGRLVVAEAEDREEDAERALDEALDILRETQAILTELILLEAPADRASWLLRGSILAAVQHVLGQLDLEERARIRESWRETQQRRPLAQLHPVLRAALPHPERPTLRGLPPAGQASAARRPSP